MLFEGLYHPPCIKVDRDKGGKHYLYLIHRFEDKPLVEEFVANTMMGIEYLWGGPVQLETSEVASVSPQPKNGLAQSQEPKEPGIKWKRVLYTMKDRKLSKRTL